MDRTLDALDYTIAKAAAILGYLIVAFIALLVLGALLPVRQPGSLDDLDAVTIDRVVNGLMREE